MELKALLERPVPLPSGPKLVALLAGEVAREAPSLRKLSQLFGADPGLAARLLIRANQPGAPASREVCSIAQALALLPAADLVPLVAQAAAAGGASAARGLDLPRFWRYSLQTAKLARALASRVRLNQAAAYTAGLVHAIGELVLYAAMPEQMAALDAQGGPLDHRRGRLERRQLGFHFADVGAELARRWHWPEALVEGLAHQVEPFEHEVYEPLAGLVHLASWRTRAGEAGQDDRALAVSFPDQVGLALGLDIDMVLQQDPLDWLIRTEHDLA